MLVSCVVLLSINCNTHQVYRIIGFSWSLKHAHPQNYSSMQHRQTTPYANSLVCLFRSTPLFSLFFSPRNYLFKKIQLKLFVLHCSFLLDQSKIRPIIFQSHCPTEFHTPLFLALGPLPYKLQDLLGPFSLDSTPVQELCYRTLKPHWLP